ncbi:hypothetical protein [Bacillus timonensis]|uniref:hypothetical protein n=1 Tax=Bacillus timonensis TaxID=1033734 RepID=UPI0002893DC2|nr:hypothetical protein [Bacillus timonensis]
MNFKRIFWGYLFILLEIQLFVVDILPEPLGYYLIFSGIATVPIENRTGNKLKKLLIGLIIISIPTVFIQQNGNLNDLGTVAGIYPWGIYTSILEIFKLIVAFFIFQLIIEAVTAHGDEFLLRKSSQTFKIYMTVMLLITLSHSFAMNLSTDVIAGYLFFTIPIGLIMEIMFLVFLWKLHKYDELQGVTF